MASDDPVDDEAMIFTEFEVYMIGGFLAGLWVPDLDDDEGCKDISTAITTVLSKK